MVVGPGSTFGARSRRVYECAGGPIGDGRAAFLLQ